MILKKDYILNNLKDKYFNDNWNIKVFRFKKWDIAYIYDNFDIIKRIRNIDYFVNTDWQYYQCIKSGYLTINHNWDLCFLKTRNRNWYTYIDIDWLYFENFNKYFR